MSRSKLNTYVQCTVGGTTPNHTLTANDGTLHVGEQDLTSIAMSGTDTLQVVLADAIDDKPLHMNVCINEFSGTQKYVLQSNGSGTYTSLKPINGLTAWLDDGPKTAATVNFQVATESQFA